MTLSYLIDTTVGDTEQLNSLDLNHCLGVAFETGNRACPTFPFPASSPSLTIEPCFHVEAHAPPQ